MVEFGQRLRALRHQKRLTQKQLALQVGVQNKIISFYEMGDRIPSPEMIIKLAAVFHVSSDYLLGIEKHETLDTSGLSEDDIAILQSLADNLRKKNETLK